MKREAAVSFFLVAISSCGRPDAVPDAGAVETYVEVWLFHGMRSLEGETTWGGSIGGFGGSIPNQARGPSPQLGECVLWRFTTDYPVPLTDRVAVDVPGVGEWELIQFQGGEYGLDGDELPPAPFLEPDATVEARFRDLTLEVGVPARPTIEAPAPGAVVELPGPVLVQWSQQGEPSIEITLAMFTAGRSFRGAQTCLVPDTGFFMLPRIEEPLDRDIGAAVLHLRYIRSAEIVSDSLQLSLDVRQFDIRDYDARVR